MLSFPRDPLIPGVTPGLMVQVQTPGRILHYIGDQLAGGHGILQENGFKELDLILLAAVGVRQGPASKAQGQYGTVDHGCCHLIPVLVAEGIERLIDTV